MNATPKYAMVSSTLKEWREAFTALRAGDRIVWNLTSTPMDLYEFRRKVFWPALEKRINLKAIGRNQQNR